MTRETRDYIAAQVAAWHKATTAGHNLAHYEERLRSALVVAEAEDLLMRYPRAALSPRVVEGEP